MALVSFLLFHFTDYESVILQSRTTPVVSWSIYSKGAKLQAETGVRPHPPCIVQVQAQKVPEQP